MIKRNIYITVVGQAMTGKTGLIKLLVGALAQHNIETDIAWGPDGDPPPTTEEFEKGRLAAIAKKTKVIIAEHQAGKRSSGSEIESINDLGIYVVHDVRHGYGVRLVVMGQPLERWFGEFSASKERARAIAARMSAELDIDVNDQIPREYEWVQPR